MASRGTSNNISHKAGEISGQAQMKKDEIVDHAKDSLDRASNDETVNTYAAQASNFLQQTGEQVKNIAQGAAEAVKNTLGMNDSNLSSGPEGLTSSTTTISQSNNPSKKI